MVFGILEVRNKEKKNNQKNPNQTKNTHQIWSPWKKQSQVKQEEIISYLSIIISFC